jgi:hypothetical protein
MIEVRERGDGADPRARSRFSSRTPGKEETASGQADRALGSDLEGPTPVWVIAELGGRA